MAQIRITPEELREGASFVNQIADSISTDLENLNSKIQEVAGNWEGVAQSSFVQSFEEIFKLFKEQFPPSVQGIASQMSGAAEAMEETDQALSQAFAGGK